VWIAWEGSEARSPVEKHLRPEEVTAVVEATEARDGDLILLVADAEHRANTALDGLRRLMADRLGLVPDAWEFVWVTDPPLFTWSEDDERWVSVHHPFTSPVGTGVEPERTRARAYDIVLNGWELGGGSIRIHRPEVQRQVFEALGLGPEEAEEKFGFLLRAFRYGVPPHGGIAIGLDRVVMLLAGVENIREVIAFPKTQTGADLLTGAPAEVDEPQLEELGIRLRPPAQHP
jgi:aspartyl-tRNA synthetase